MAVFGGLLELRDGPELLAEHLNAGRNVLYLGGSVIDEGLEPRVQLVQVPDAVGLLLRM